jgi:Flp pilus assembly protein TadG
MRRLRGDRGSAALFVAVFAPAMIFMAGLVIDGGAALEARQRAADIAEQAARAGANQCDVALLRSAGECRITDFGAVDTAVRPYRTTDGVTTLTAGPIEPVPGAGNQYYGVRVTVTMTFRTTLLGIVPAYKELTITGTADAVAVTRL